MSPRKVWSRTRRRTWSGSGTKVPAVGAKTAVVSTRVGLRTRMLSRWRPRATRAGAFRITRSFNLSSTMSSRGARDHPRPRLAVFEVIDCVPGGLGDILRVYQGRTRRPHQSGPPGPNCQRCGCKPTGRPRLAHGQGRESEAVAWPLGPSEHDSVAAIAHRVQKGADRDCACGERRPAIGVRGRGVPRGGRHPYARPLQQLVGRPGRSRDCKSARTRSPRDFTASAMRSLQFRAVQSLPSRLVKPRPCRH